MADWPAIFQFNAPNLFMLISWLLLIKSAKKSKFKNFATTIYKISEMITDKKNLINILFSVFMKRP